MGFSGTYSGTSAQNSKMLSWMKAKGYKQGIYGLSQDELAWTQEDKPEVIFNSPKSQRLQDFLSKVL